MIGAKVRAEHRRVQMTKGDSLETRPGRNKEDLRRYRKQLAAFAGRVIARSELTSLSFVDSLREESIAALKDKPVSKFEIAFPDRMGSRFEAYVDKLHRANSKNVYIWTKLSNEWGLFRAESIKAVNMAFPYEIDPNGVMSLLTDDCADCLRLDWSEDISGERRLEIKATGRIWPGVTY